MDFDWKDFDAQMKGRTQREDCPIPQGFAERLEGRLEDLPKRKKRPGRRALILIAAILLLSACVSAGTVVLHRARTYYFDTAQQAQQAADQAAQESGASAAAYGVTSGPVEDYPAQEPIDLQHLFSHEEILEHRTGGPGDSWTEMMIAVNDCAKSWWRGWKRNIRRFPAACTTAGKKVSARGKIPLFFILRPLPGSTKRKTERPSPCSGCSSQGLTIQQTAIWWMTPWIKPRSILQPTASP